MKVLYIVTAAEFSGPSRHVLWLMEYLMKQGHTVGLVSAPEPRLMREAQKLGAWVFPNPYFVRPIRPHCDIQSLWPVFRAIMAFRPDLVSAHSTKAGYAARLACAVLRRRVIFTVHGWAFTEGRTYRKRWLLAQAESLAAKFTTKIICVSKHDRDLALRFKVVRADQLVVLHNGVDHEPFLKGDRVKAREDFGLGSSPVLTMVGRLVPQKDPLMLLEACCRLEGKCKLLVVGDGELRRPIEEFISQNDLDQQVILAGERKDIPEILATSDVFVLSSRWEGLPRAIIEAMMAGLPVVATRVGGVPELVEDGVTGFLVPPGGPEALAEVIQKLLDSEDLRRRMGHAGREKALREFTLDRMLRQTYAVYEEVLAR